MQGYKECIHQGKCQLSYADTLTIALLHMLVCVYISTSIHQSDPPDTILYDVRGYSSGVPRTNADGSSAYWDNLMDQPAYIWTDTDVKQCLTSGSHISVVGVKFRLPAIKLSTTTRGKRKRQETGWQIRSDTDYHIWTTTWWLDRYWAINIHRK